MRCEMDDGRCGGIEDRMYVGMQYGMCDGMGNGMSCGMECGLL